ncbi:MAG: class I SAM-dependent methyltransferase [Gammaproteobacteria bacterium]
MQTHNANVTRQFDPRASAYLTSAVHARGEDLDALAQVIGHQPDATVLDMGCGGGHVAFRLAPAVGRVVACDLSQPMLDVVAAEAASRGLDNIITKRCAAEDLPCPDASFDIVATRFSAHHWENVPAALAQMRRALKEGGTAVFVDVASPGQPLLDTWLQAFELLRDPSHVRNATPAEWNTILDKAGFAMTGTQRFKLRLEFASWVERMKTPALHVEAIRALQACAGAEVADYFAIEADGSFTVDVILVAATTAPQRA